MRIKLDIEKDASEERKKEKDIDERIFETKLK